MAFVFQPNWPTARASWVEVLIATLFDLFNVLTAACSMHLSRAEPLLAILRSCTCSSLGPGQSTAAYCWRQNRGITTRGSCGCNCYDSICNSDTSYVSSRSRNGCGDSVGASITICSGISRTQTFRNGRLESLPSRHRFGESCLLGVVVIRWQRHRRQDADDGHHDHQLDEGEALLNALFHASLLKMGLGPVDSNVKLSTMRA
jgi:hypothetical protein